MNHEAVQPSGVEQLRTLESLQVQLDEALESLQVHFNGAMEVVKTAAAQREELSSRPPETQPEETEPREAVRHADVEQLRALESLQAQLTEAMKAATFSVAKPVTAQRKPPSQPLEMQSEGTLPHAIAPPAKMSSNRPLFNRLRRSSIKR